MKPESPNRVFEEYLRSLNPQEEKHNKMSVAGLQALEEENAASTEELNALIKGISAQKANTEVQTNVEDENIQTTLMEQAAEEHQRKENEERYKAEQEAKKRIEEEQRKAEEELEKKKQKKFSFFGRKNKKADVEEQKEEIEENSSVDIETDSSEGKKEASEEKEETPTISKKEKNFFAKVFVAPKKVSKKEKEEETTEHETEQDWEYIATHDEMTELLNKKAFDISSGKTYPVFGVTVMDINNLKYINARFGNIKGDEVILKMVETLKGVFKDGEIYRVDGDEFIIISKGEERNELKLLLKSLVSKLNYEYQQMTSKDDHLIYAATFGIHVGEDNETIRSAAKKARNWMEEEKKEYHNAHPEFTMEDNRIQEKTDEEKLEEAVTQDDYDKMLPREWQELKNNVLQLHETPSPATVQRIMDSVNEKIATDAITIRGAVMTSQNFNDIFIFKNPAILVGMVENVKYNLDFSYLYIITREGSQYFGCDTFSDEVDQVFKEIGTAIRTRVVRTQEDLHKVNAIRIFQNVYSDFPE